MLRGMVAAAGAVLVAVMMSACSTAPKTQTDREVLHNDAMSAFNDFKATDPSLEQFLHNSVGYAIFPSIGKAGAGIGGAFGHGELYDKGGKQIGWTDMTQATVGAELGAQTYAELLVFQTPIAMSDFEAGNYSFAAQASAIALKPGAAAQAAYENGVAVFVQPKGGLMAEADIGGQKFNYEAMGNGH